MIYIRYRRRNGGATEQGQQIKITQNEKADHFQRMPEGVGMSLFVVTLCKYHQLRRYTHIWNVVHVVISQRLKLCNQLANRERRREREYLDKPFVVHLSLWHLK